MMSSSSKKKAVVKVGMDEGENGPPHFPCPALAPLLYEH